VDALPQFYADRMPAYHELLIAVDNEKAERDERIRRAQQRRNGG
jgi:hypothetical protein